MNINRLRMARRLLRRQLNEFRRVVAVEQRYPTAKIHWSVQIRGPVEKLQLGDRVTIRSGSVLHLGGAAWCEHKGLIHIGTDSVLSHHTVIYGCGSGGVIIGDRVDCGPHVGIFSSRSAYPDSGHVFDPVRIGNDVTIFASAVISPGVSIGNGAVVAAGSVVPRDMPAAVLIGGAPARVLRHF